MYIEFILIGFNDILVVKAIGVNIDAFDGTNFFWVGFIDIFK